MGIEGILLSVWNLLKMIQALPSSLPTKSQKLFKNASDQIPTLP